MSKFRRGEGKPVVALDIDGTLGDYHSHFLWFAERWLGMKMPSATKVNPGMPLSVFMNVPHEVYRECKLAYRQGGLKRFMPCYPGASELTQKIRDGGAEVWICTTRPYLRLDNIDPDTREWLHRNDIEYDAVIFGGIDDENNKYEELVRQVGRHRIVAAVDDLPEQINRAKACGILKVYVRDQPYNRAIEGKDQFSFSGENQYRVDDLEKLSRLILSDIENWKAKHE